MILRNYGGSGVWCGMVDASELGIEEGVDVLVLGQSGERYLLHVKEVESRRDDGSRLRVGGDEYVLWLQDKGDQLCDYAVLYERSESNPIGVAYKQEDVTDLVVDPDEDEYLADVV